MPDFLHTITSGQSLSIGGAGGSALSTVSEEPNAYLVASGGSLAPLAGSASQRPELSMGYRLAGARPAQRLGFSTHGEGSRTIAELSPGGSTGLFEIAVARATLIRDAELAASRSYGVEAVHWIQGEQDQVLGTSLNAYVTAMLELKDAYDAAIEDLTGEDATPFISSQTATWAYSETPARIGLAQLEAARTTPGVYLVGGQYQIPHADDLHPTNVGYYYLGELHARAHQAIIDGDGWAPFAPTGYVVTPGYVDVFYHVPTGALEFDTTTIAAQTNMGFSLAGTSATITGVTLIGSDTVRLALSQPITESGAQVGYGVSSVIGGRGVGNLCDGETTTSVYDGARLANWAAHSLDTVDVVAPLVFNATALYLVGTGGRLYPITG